MDSSRDPSPEGPARNKPGIGSLLCCAAACVILLALMLVRASSQGWLETSSWVGEYLWIVAPYGAVALAAAVFWRGRFFSTWTFVAAVLGTITNPAAYFLIYLALGGHEDSAST